MKRDNGATTAINRAEQAQQLIGAYGQFREDLTVKERRALMTAALEAVGTKGVERFITPEGTATLAEMEAMQQQAAQMAMMPPPPQLPPGEGAPRVEPLRRGNVGRAGAGDSRPPRGRCRVRWHPKPCENRPCYRCVRGENSFWIWLTILAYTIFAAYALSPLFHLAGGER